MLKRITGVFILVSLVFAFAPVKSGETRGLFSKERDNERTRLSVNRKGADEQQQPSTLKSRMGRLFSPYSYNQQPEVQVESEELNEEVNKLYTNQYRNF